MDTREALAMDVERHIDADQPIAPLDRIAAVRDSPIYVRLDHRPDFCALDQPSNPNLHTHIQILATTVAGHGRRVVEHRIAPLEA
jgi:hypothetical protein